MITLYSLRWATITFAMISFPALAGATSPPSIYHATYDVHYGGFTVGTVDRSFTTTPTNYKLILKSRTIIPFVFYSSTQRSEGHWLNNDPVPVIYNQNVNDQTATLHFTKSALDTLKQKYHSQSTLPVFDELSYQVALQHDLSKGKTSFNYLIWQNKKLREYHFKILGEEAISTPLGKLETIKLTRTNGGRRTTILWLAKKYEYLPVAFMQNRPGKPQVKAIISGLIWGNTST
jgi:hypothetical protein